MRVLIADDQPNVRFAYRVLLGTKSGIEIVGEAGDAEELVVKTVDTYPDVVLLDWELPGLTRNSLNQLRRVSQSMVVIALSGRSEVGRVALAAGVDAFVSKVEPPERLLAVISDSSSFLPYATGKLLPSKL